MKYFLRILAFLFISFGFGYSYDRYDLQDATNYFNDLKNNVPKIVPVTNFISEGPFDFSDSGVDFNKYIGGSSSNTIVRPICNGCYLMREPHRLDGYMTIGSSYISKYIEFYPNHIPPTLEESYYEFADNVDSSYNVWWYDSAPKNSTVALVRIVTNNSDGTYYVVDKSYTPGKNYGYVNQVSVIVLDSFDRLYGQDYDYMIYPDSFKPKKSLCGSDREYIAGLCVLKGYDVPCLDENKYFSEKLGKCVPACPEGAYYNSFSDECTSTCDNVSNREERFDCLCKERGFVGYKSSIVSKEFVITNTPNGGFSDVLYTGSIYCSTGELNSGDVSDYLKNKGYDDKDLKQATSDFFEINDVIDKDNSSDSGSSDGTGGGSSGGEQGSTEPMTPEQQQQEQDRNECKAIVAAITADFRAYIQKYVNNGIDCSDSNAVQLARDAKSTIEMKVQTYNQSKCATAYHRINVTVPVYSCKTDPTKPDPIEPPAPQNPSDTIKYDENTKTVTITDSTGNTQAVTPTDVTKNDKGELQTIKYTDPETGKTIEYKVKEDGTWERVEYPGQGTGTGTNPSDKEPGTGQGDGKPGGSSDGEGAGTSEDGKDDGNKDGEGNFEGGEFGALGNANDFDEGGLLSGLNDELDSLSDDNLGFLESIIDNITSYIDDLKGSLDNVAEKASALSDNPFSSSNVTSCAIDFSLLDKSIKIDLCQYISQFKNLFYAIFYLALNVFIAFGMFRLFVLILVSI